MVPPVNRGLNVIAQRPFKKEMKFSNLEVEELYKLACKYTRKALGEHFTAPKFEVALSGEKWKQLFQGIAQRRRGEFPEGLPLEVPAILVRALGQAEVIGNPDVLPRYPRFLILTSFVHELLHYLRPNWTEERVIKESELIVQKLEPKELEGGGGLIQMALSLSDLPSDFVLWGAEVVDNQKAASRAEEPGERIQLYELWGREFGYEVMFGKRSNSQFLSKGPLHIKNSVSLYRSEEGAKEAYEFSRRELKARTPASIEVTIPENIGDKSMGLQVDEKRGGAEFVIYSINFICKDVIASMVAMGQKAGLDFGEVVNLARKVEERIKRRIPKS